MCSFVIVWDSPDIWTVSLGTLREASEIYWVVLIWTSDAQASRWLMLSASRSLTEDKYWRHFMLLEHDEQIDVHNNISLPLICLKINHHFRKSFHWENTNQLGPIIRLHWSTVLFQGSTSHQQVWFRDLQRKQTASIYQAFKQTPPLFNLFKPTFSKTSSINWVQTEQAFIWGWR